MQIIIGVDAGVWTAFAVLDLNGRLVALKSSKAWSEKDFFKQLSDYSPIIVACDTKPASRLSKKVASIFHARLYVPKHSLQIIEKVKLAKHQAKNVHERDALAAARKAYNSTVQNKVRQFVRIAGEPTDKQKRLVIKGMSMKEAITNP